MIHPKLINFGILEAHLSINFQMQVVKNLHSRQKFQRNCVRLCRRQLVWLPHAKHLFKENHILKAFCI